MGLTMGTFAAFRGFSPLGNSDAILVEWPQLIVAERLPDRILLIGK